MSYEKQTWATGDVITAEKLNHMEDGIAGDEANKFIVNITDNGDSTYSSDKTAKEIYEANESGMTPVAIYYGNEYSLYLIDGDRGYRAGFRDSEWNSNQREQTTISINTNTAGTTTNVLVTTLVGYLVPAYDISDTGKVLMVDSQGSLVWGAPSST